MRWRQTRVLAATIRHSPGTRAELFYGLPAPESLGVARRPTHSHPHDPTDEDRAPYSSGTLGNRGCHPNSPARRGGAAGALDDVDRAQHRHHAVMPAGVRGRLPSAPVSRETGGLAHDVGREASLEPSREPGRLRARGLVRTPVEREVPATCADQSQPTPAIPIIPPTDQKVGGSRVFVVGAGDRSPSGVLSPSNARLSASRAAASTCVPRLRAQPRIARTRRRSF